MKIVYQAPPFDSFEVFRDSLPEIIKSKLEELSEQVNFHAKMILSKERMLADPPYWCQWLYKYSPNCKWLAKEIIEVLNIQDHRLELIKLMQQQKRFNWMNFRLSEVNFEPRMTIQQFKELNPLIEVIRSYQNLSYNNKILCPFHSEKSASCQIYKNNRGYCFGCNKSFDVIDYLKKMTGLPINKILAK